MDRTPYQENIIKRYYENKPEIMLQKRSLQEYYSAEATLRRAMVRLKASGQHDIN